jgi:hypothetical protein
MSFTFGFNGDDIEDDEKNHEEQDDALVGQISDYTISDQNLESKHTATLPPQRHSLEELVGSILSCSCETLVLYPVAAVQGVAEEFDTQAPFCIGSSTAHIKARCANPGKSLLFCWSPSFNLIVACF